MKRVKRFLSLFLSVCLLLGLLPSTALASNDKIMAENIQIGDFLSFGTFNDHPMLWQVVDNTNGKLKIFSTDILFNGPIDADINMHGNASVMEGETNWHTSDIRQYLNSNDSTVSYKGELPNYGSLPGFLTNFTSDELALIQDTTHKSLVHYSTSGVEKDGGTKYARDTFFNGTSFDIDAYNELAYVNVTEKVFLPDMMDLRELRDNGLGYTRYAYSEYSDSFVETADSGFFTRTPVYSVISAFSTTYYYGVYYVHTLFGTSTAEAERGIRPMCYIQLDNEQTITGSGTLESPYALSFGSDDTGSSDSLQLVSRSPESGGVLAGDDLVVSMTFNLDIESVQTGISFDENNNTVIHGNFSIVRQIESADGWEFETVYSLSEGDNVETDVTINGNTIIIDASEAELISGETYYVLMDNGVITFKDTDETIGFGGTEWTFTVAGQKAGNFRYKAQYGITEYPYVYNDNWFLEPSTVYNHDLAKMSLRMAIAAYGTGSNEDGSEYIQELLTDELQFDNLMIEYPTPERNTIGYAIGSKNISSGGKNKSLIAVAIRGGGYGAEWGGNFIVGTGDIHQGFLTAAKQVENGLIGYLDTYESSLSDDYIVWIVGYSRAAATANLVAKRLDDGNISGIGPENVFAYCFECPQNSRAANLTASQYNNIMNIMNPLDFVTMVAMDQWEFGRYGKNYYLPYAEATPNYDSLKTAMSNVYSAILDKSTSFDGLPWAEALKATTEVSGQLYVTESLMDYLATGFASPEQYTAKHQEAVATLIQNTLGGDDASVDLLPLLMALFELIDNNADGDGWTDLKAASAISLFAAGVVPYTHYPELCLAWMDSLEGEAAYISSKYRRVFINCPVDVSVYNSADILVGQIVNRTIQDIENGISIYIDADDQIVISLPITEEYRIDMEATGEGTVTYTVTEHNIETSSSERVVSYPLIEVKSGDSLIGSIENLYEVEAAEYNLTYNGTEQSAAVDQSGDDVAEYAVTVNVEGNGSVAYNGKAVYGEYRKMSATPDDGAEFVGWFINGELVSAKNECRFCVTSDMTFTAKFTSIKSDGEDSSNDKPICPSAPSVNIPDKVKNCPFIDVNEDDYFFSAVLWADENGITTGTSDTTFSPDMTCTRAQAVTFLWRAAGSPEPKSNVMPFEDVAAEAYYYKAVLWAVENSITNGTSSTTFSPDADCTRAQIVTFLWRSQKSPAITAANPFADVAAEAYYYDAVLWAVDEKITNGTSSTTFSPDTDCTRAQIVTFLYRCLSDK